MAKPAEYDIRQLAQQFRASVTELVAKGPVCSGDSLGTKHRRLKSFSALSPLRQRRFVSEEGYLVHGNIFSHRDWEGVHMSEPYTVNVACARNRLVNISCADGFHNGRSVSLIGD